MLLFSDLKYKNHLLCSTLDGAVGMNCQEGHNVDPATAQCGKRKKTTPPSEVFCYAFL